MAPRILPQGPPEDVSQRPPALPLPPLVTATPGETSPLRRTRFPREDIPGAARLSYPGSVISTWRNGGSGLSPIGYALNCRSSAGWRSAQKVRRIQGAPTPPGHFRWAPQICLFGGLPPNRRAVPATVLRWGTPPYGALPEHPTAGVLEEMMPWGPLRDCDQFAPKRCPPYYWNGTPARAVSSASPSPLFRVLPCDGSPAIPPPGGRCGGTPRAG
jgi:hypothetical protein